MAKKQQKIIAGNWKMNPNSVEEVKRIFNSVKAKTMKAKNIFTIVCPPFPYIAQCKKLFAGDYMAVGAQDVYYEYSGSFTGEVSAEMIASVGATYVIIGHSERRKMGETDDIVAQKTNAALKSGLKTIVCIGEGERDLQGGYLELLKNQIKQSLAKVERRYMKNVIIAYEPVWAIGAKEAMTPADLYEMTIFIKKVLSDIYGQEDGKKTKILYGGSVTFRNAKDIVAIGKVDGLLVGRESINAEGFGEIIKVVDEIN
jgi:triosephosphate isomerase